MKNRFDTQFGRLTYYESWIDSKKKEKRKNIPSKPKRQNHFSIGILQNFCFLFSLCEFLSLSISSLNFYVDGFSLEERDGDFLLRHMVQVDQKEFFKKAKTKNKRTTL